MKPPGTYTKRIVSATVHLTFVMLLFGSSVNRAAPETGWRAQIVRSVATEEKVVALTYDDGPHPVFTRRILDILDEYHAKATFFVIGSVAEAHPDVVRDVALRGHAIGNHTHNHPASASLQARKRAVFELEKCRQAIQNLTAKPDLLFRPPRGAMQAQMLAVARERQYATVLWSICANHREAPTPEMMAERVLARVRPGAIILAHDGANRARWKDVAATRLIVKSLHRQGYRFVTVPELLKMRQ